MYSLIVLIALSSLYCVTPLSLTGGQLTVVLDDLFPRPLSYSSTRTGDRFLGALTDWNFYLSLSLNAGQAYCGENSISTIYNILPMPPGEAGVDFSITAACLLNFADNGEEERLKLRTKSTRSTLLSPPPIVYIELNGTVTVREDASLPISGADIFEWILTSTSVLEGSSPGFKAVTSLDVAGFELVSFSPVPLANTSACFHVPDDNGNSPHCGGDSYYVDSWSEVALDEWYTPTWSNTIITGQVDINNVAGNSLSCLDGASSRLSPGPLATVVAGGWSYTGKTGIATLSDNKHLPFSTGPRSYDAPGRCSHFTISPSRITSEFLCGSTLPYKLSVGVFQDLTQDGTISSDDIHFWRRHQFDRVDLVYRTTLPHKIGVDYSAYEPQSTWGRMSFVPDVLEYGKNMSALFDYYPLTPILVGFQGLGHDTLYPSLDVINVRSGGVDGLKAYAEALIELSPGSSVSYHINTDEAYSHFDGKPNPEFDIGICRLNVDHSTPWYSNCSVTHEQNPDCGIRCSISKTRDAVSFGRYERIGKIFSVIPEGLRTIHSDAWRDVGASWERTGYLSMESENFCGQMADKKFWASHNASIGNEGENGQPAEMLGNIVMEWHGNGYDVSLWGRIATCSSMGFDQDIYCYAPGGKCSASSISDSFWMNAKIYQLALTDELLGDSADGEHYRFLGGGRVMKVHVNRVSDEIRGGGGGGGGETKKVNSNRGSDEIRGRGGETKKVNGNRMSGDVPVPSFRHRGVDLGPPSSWPYGGDVIPVARANSVFVPLVLLDGTLSLNTAHVYLASNAPSPPPLNKSCALYSQDPSVYKLAENVAFTDWNEDYLAQFELDPSLPEPVAAQQCKSACDGNVTCQGFDMIKVTPFSGKTKPLCTLFSHPIGCEEDDNQVSGVKAPLPIPTPSPAGINLTWTLPLSWVGKALTATNVNPTGNNTAAQFDLQGRMLTVIDVIPGQAVRFVAAL